MDGTIKKLLAQRGFGFIAAGGQEYFFHMSGVQGVHFDELREGQQVQFTTENDPRGRGQRAVNVRLAGG